MTISSEAGSKVGDTKLTVTPKKLKGNSYKYKISSTSITPPEFGEKTLTGYSAWNGKDLTVADGQYVGIVECDANGEADRFGQVKCVSRKPVVLPLEDDPYTYPGTEIELDASDCDATTTQTGDYAYTLAYTGTPAVLSSENRDALGFDVSATHNINTLIEIPNAAGDTGVEWNGKAVSADEIREVEGSYYIEVVFGLKDDDGYKLASGATSVTIGYGEVTTTFTLDFSGVG